MNDEAKKFLKENKGVIIAAIILILAIIGSFAEASEIRAIPEGSFYEKTPEGVAICFNISETQIACGFAPRGTWNIYDKEQQEEEKTSYEFSV